MKRGVVLCLLTGLLLTVLYGCAAAATPEEAVERMCKAEVSLPAGRVYVLSASEDSEKYVSDGLLTALFGDGSYPWEMDEVTDAAFYLSYTAPKEFLVFDCKSAGGAEAVAALCLRRLETLRLIWNDSDSEALLSAAEVKIRGKRVLFCVSADPGNALRAG